MEQNESQGQQPRRRFLGSFLAGAAGLGALFLAPRKARAQSKEQPRPGATETGPILYRRTEEVERYYRTLYR